MGGYASRSRASARSRSRPWYHGGAPARRSSGGAHRFSCGAKSAARSAALWCTAASARSSHETEGRQQGVERQRREQDQTGIAIRLEQPQAQRRVVDVEAADLPGKMRREGREPQPEDEARAGAPPGGADESHREREEDRQHRPGTRTEQE